MGSAVSAVTGGINSVVNGVMGPVGNVIGGITGPVFGAAGEGLSALADGIIKAIPDVPIADQTNLQNQIDNSRDLNRQYIANSQQSQAQANQGYQNTNTAIGQAQNAIGQAQNVNTGIGSNVNNAIGLVGQTAAGGGAAQQAANAQLQAGTDQAIRTQQAIANSGNLSQMIGGQKTAMDNAAQLTQQNANQAAMLQAGMAANAQQNYTGAAAQQAGQAAANAGLQQQQTAASQNMYNTAQNAAENYAGQANTAAGNALTGQTNALGLEQTALGQTGQNKAMAVGGVLNAAGGAAGGALGSDENSKFDIKYAGSPKFGPNPNITSGRPVYGESTPNGVSGSQIGSKPVYDSDSNSDEKKKEKGKELSKALGSSFNFNTSAPKWNIIQSDKDEKKDINKNDKVSAFLDAIDPVSFKYKDPSGEMGKTPGEHLGVIAQQVEKAPGGASMIIETPEGKGIDLASAVGTLMAAAAESHNRVKELEDLFKSKMKKKDKK